MLISAESHPVDVLQITKPWCPPDLGSGRRWTKYPNATTERWSERLETSVGVIEYSTSPGAGEGCRRFAGIPSDRAPGAKRVGVHWNTLFSTLAANNPSAAARFKIAFIHEDDAPGLMALLIIEHLTSSGPTGSSIPTPPAQRGRSRP